MGENQDDLTDAIKMCRLKLIVILGMDFDFTMSDSDVLWSLAEHIEQEQACNAELLKETVRLRDVIRKLDSELAEARRG